jgi:hypothetical protein
MSAPDDDLSRALKGLRDEVKRLDDGASRVGKLVMLRVGEALAAAIEMRRAGRSRFKSLAAEKSAIEDFTQQGGERAGEQLSDRRPRPPPRPPSGAFLLFALGGGRHPAWR